MAQSNLTAQSNLMAQSPVQSDEPVAGTASTHPESLIRSLSDPSYSARQLAFERLLTIGDASIPAIEQALVASDADLAERLVRLLSELAIDPHTPPGPSALAALRRVAANPVALHGTLAKRSIESLEAQQREVALAELIQIGASTGTGDKQVLTTNSIDVVWLHIGKEFRGTERDLERLQWMQGIQLLILEGPKVSASWIDKAALMPGLRVLQIKKASITNDDVALLKKIRRLEILEFINTPIDDQTIEHIKSVAVWNAIRLFGTQITSRGADELRQAFDDIEIIFGRGGYLGVRVRDQQSIRIDPSPGSAAEAAGLQLDDEILSINGVKLDNFEDLRKELANYAPGEQVAIAILRKDPLSMEPLEMTLQVTLGEQK